MLPYPIRIRVQHSDTEACRQLLFIRSSKQKCPSRLTASAKWRFRTRRPASRCAIRSFISSVETVTVLCLRLSVRLNPALRSSSRSPTPPAARWPSSPTTSCRSRPNRTAAAWPSCSPSLTTSTSTPTGTPWEPSARTSSATRRSTGRCTTIRSAVLSEGKPKGPV